MAGPFRIILWLLILSTIGSSALLAQTTHPLNQQSPTAWNSVNFTGIRGYRFQCNANNVTVTELGCYYPDSNTNSKTLCLFDFNTQQLLASTTTTPGSGWIWSTLSSPVSLTNGSQYVVTGYSTTGHYYNNGVPASWQPTGTIQYMDMRYQNSPTSATQFPGGGFLTTSHHGVVDIGYTTSSAPIITSSAPTLATVGSNYSYTPTATGNPTPTFSISPDPATLGSGWLTWNGSTLSGTPAAGDVGSYGPFTITATNGNSPDDIETFTLNVAQPFAEIDIEDPNANAVTSGDTYTIYAALSGVSSVGDFTITNNGNVDLTFSNTPVVTESALVNCTLNTTQPTGPVTPGNNTTLGVDVTPSGTGAFSFTLTIDNNDSDEGSYVINFTGIAKASAEPEIAVWDSGNSDVADGSTINEINTGTSAFARSFTIRNEGGATLTLSGTTPVMISAENNCTVNVTQPGNSLAAASTWAAVTDTFSLDITPSGDGLFSFVVTIPNNDSNEGSYSFTFSGDTASGSGGGSISGGGGGGGGGGGCAVHDANTAWLMLLLAIASAIGITAIRKRRAA